jgi:deoxycytidylate deaminase
MPKVKSRASRKSTSQLSKLPPFLDSEVIVGVVGRIGVEIDKLITIVEDTAASLDYKVEHIKLTKFIPRIGGLPRVYEQPVEKKYNSYITFCNRLRERTHVKDVMALLAILKIQDHRKMELGSQKIPAKRTLYIVDQLKRPEEVKLLRLVYGPLFVQVSCHAPLEKRKSHLLQRILEGHKSSKLYEQWSAEADKLIKRDDSEDSESCGQRVAETFPLADLIVDTSNVQSAKELTVRFFRAFFGDLTVSPSIKEYGMNLATNAAFRSIDLSRQVGAAILTKNGEVIALGCNEVPKAGGGTYWTGDKGDTRDYAKGYDYNTNRKRGMLIDVVMRLKQMKLLSRNISDLGEQEIEEKLFGKGMETIKDAQILDTSEYGRPLHGEMCALMDAARLGHAVKDQVLYVTTFPCHNCAKHIVGSGLSEVYYLQPYAKSEASLLYPDSISTDTDGMPEGHIPFRQFTGITPRRYFQFFEKERLKDSEGHLRKWDQKNSYPVFGTSPSTYIDLEALCLTQAAGKMPRKYNFLVKRH